MEFKGGGARESWDETTIIKHLKQKITVCVHPIKCFNLTKKKSSKGEG